MTLRSQSTSPDDVARGPQAAQATLPFDADTDADQPIGYALTARARRSVAPDDLPRLHLVPGSSDPASARTFAPGRAGVAGTAHLTTSTDTLRQHGSRHPGAIAGLHDGFLDDPGDTRPARARALHRAGVDVSGIARTLDLDELLVRAWVDGIVPRRVVGRRRVATAGTGALAIDAQVRPPVASALLVDDPQVFAAVGVRAGLPHEPASTPATADAAETETVRLVREGVDDATPTYEQLRTEARAVAAERLREEPGLGAGLGLLVGLAELATTSVTVTTVDVRLAAAVVRWLQGTLGVTDAQLRVVLQLGPDAPADIARYRWADALDLPRERVRTTRWGGAPGAGEVRALLRVADADVAAAIAGWRDALLDHQEGADF